MAGGRHTLRRRVLARLAALAPLLLRPLLRLLQATLRIEFVGDEALRARWRGGQQAVLAFWHNRLLMLPIVTAGQRACIMVSQHRDGDLGTGLLEAWGVHTVRGSATRGAVGAFFRLVDAYRQGYNLAVIPDGPRGPRYVAKRGVIHVAKAVQAPIFPIAYAASRVRHLRSWDRLAIPLPFARVVVAVGEPLLVPAAASAAELAVLRDELEGRLRQVTADVEARVGMAAVGLDVAAARQAAESPRP